jgi:hypothetical protein
MPSKSALSLMWVALLSVLIVTSCSDSDEPVPNPVDTTDTTDTTGTTTTYDVADGYYIVGTGTALAEPDAKGVMTVTRNEVVNSKYNDGTFAEDYRSSLLEKYIAVKAGGTFSIVEIESKKPTAFGPASDFAKIAEDSLDGNEPKKGLWKGAFEEGDATFTVEEDGLYHVVIDTEIGKVVVAKVEWGIIGGSTPNGWNGSTPLVATFDLNKMEFKATETNLTVGDYKLRYSDGWKILIDETVDADGEGALGLNVNTNFGGTAIDAIVPGGDNVPHTVNGTYTITVTWELGSGISASLEKTGELVLDPTTFIFSFIGTATGDWETDVDLAYDSNDGDMYSFKATAVPFVAGGEFKIRKDYDWGTNFGWGVTIEGDTGNFSDKDGNILVAADKTYDCVFKYNNAGGAHVLVLTESVK